MKDNELKIGTINRTTKSVGFTIKYEVQVTCTTSFYDYFLTQLTAAQQTETDPRKQIDLRCLLGLIEQTGKEMLFTLNSTQAEVLNKTLQQSIANFDVASQKKIATAVKTERLLKKNVIIKVILP